MRQGGACVPRHPVAPSSAHAAKAPRCVRAPCSPQSMVASAIGWLRRIGVVIPFAVALTIGGAVLVTHSVWMHAKALLAQILLDRAFAQTVATGRPTKPWSWADTWPVARVAVPRLGKSAIVLAGASGQALAFGPGHVDGTPAAGEPGTAIYSGHRDTHFDFLGKVVIGDEIRVTRRDGRDVRFRVTGTSVVLWDASGIDPLAAGRNLALVTCWPLDGTLAGPLRYVVHAQMVGALP